MRYYIADNHFHHARMNTAMDKRGFESLEAMHDYMIKQWNSVVRKNDEVVILGDFSPWKTTKDFSRAAAVTMCCGKSSPGS